MIYKRNSYDPVIEEIHRTREAMAEKFGGNIAAILEDARKRQAASGRPEWHGPVSKEATHSNGRGADDLPVDGSSPDVG